MPLARALNDVQGVAQRTRTPPWYKGDMRWNPSVQKPRAPSGLGVSADVSGAAAPGHVTDRRRRQLPAERLEELDRELTSLARSGGALRLRLGEVVERLEPAELGFSSPKAWAAERLQRTGRWAGDSAVVARRLAELPLIRAAVLDGTLGWSMAEVLARAANPANEAELLAGALQMTVRQMKEQLKDTPDEEGEREPRRTVRIALPIEDYWKFVAAKKLIGALTGTETHNQVVEALLAEGMTTLIHECPDVRVPEGIDPEVAEGMRTWREELARMQRDGEVACEALFERVTPPRVEHPLLERELPGSHRELDALARELVQELNRRDLRIGRVANELFRSPPAATRTAWARLGFGSQHQYAGERLGMSRSALLGRMALARKATALPVLGEWLDDGRVGFAAVEAIGRVASRATVVPWLERAAVRTVKHLREELEAAEVTAKATGDLADLMPPDDETLEAVRTLERRALDRARRTPENTGEAGQASVQMFGAGLPAGLGWRVLEFRVREDLAEFWDIMKRVFLRERPAERFLKYLVDALWDTWADSVEVGTAYQDVYLRGRYRCESPTCERRDVTPHHIVFRSQGGGEERTNLVAVCSVCHLQLVHSGLLKVVGEAPELVWVFGREPVLSVDGRAVVSRHE